ncbi:MAG: 2Fe-2S iron-sulfur cluster-binding protein, partial [Flavobacteriaceae bacterium]
IHNVEKIESLIPDSIGSNINLKSINFFQVNKDYNFFPNIENKHVKSVLDTALQNKLDVPYSCQGGVCSSCIARIKSGTAEMAANQILTDEEIEEGLILTCQAHATSSHLVVDYDDV